MTITPDDLVRREVCYCASSLIATLAGAAYTGECSAEGTDLQALAEQAFELAATTDDWEEAAREHGCEPSGNLWTYALGADGGWRTATTLEEICAERDIEPYQREVYEHWIVTDWLAEQLAARGEKVDHDFAGLTIWARTCTGQSIAADGVIIAICEDLNRA